MSVYPPPSFIEYIPIFNPIDWEATIDEGITIAYLNTNYLKYPVAQGLETLDGIINLGDTTLATNLFMSGVDGVNYIQFPNGSKQYVASSPVNNDITPNSVVITPTANPPDTSTTIQNYYNNGANYSLNIRTPYYYPNNVPSSRRQNFVDICWDNSIATSIYQNVVIEYKHYLRPDSNSVSQPANGTMLFYDYGTICFSIGWLKQQFPSGLNVSSANNENITLNPCSRGSSNNGNWVMNANIQLQYYGTSNNRITIWYDNEPFDASGYTGICNTWSSFSAKINNTGGNVSAGYVDYPLWFEVNSTTSP
jgi:hypothetical protein